MFKTLAATALLALLIPTFTTADAQAADPAVKEARQASKDAKRHHKQTDRLVRKWEKASNKGNDKKLTRLDNDVSDLYSGELARLRNLGVPTKKLEPQPINPDFPEKVIRLAPENPKMEALRDDLVALRDLQDRFDNGRATDRDLQRKSRLLGVVNNNIEERFLRAENRLLKAKS